jgi:hypothetical protein
VLLFDYFAGGTGTIAKLLRESLLNEATISETLYVICRIDGIKNASNYIEECANKIGLIAPSERVAHLAGYMKCKFPVSLADCWELATGKTFRVPCLFAFREAESLRNLQLITEEIQIKFLDELQSSD